MSKKNLYDLIKQLLTHNPQLRDSDHELIWEIWKLEKSVMIVDGREYITKDRYDEATHFETIRRTRQKVQEYYKDLRSSPGVQSYKNRKRREKGTHAYRERLKKPNVGKVPVFDNRKGIVTFVDKTDA